MCLPASVVEDTALTRRDALVVASVRAKLIAKLDLSSLKLILNEGVYASIVRILTSGVASLGLVGVQVLFGLLCDLFVVGHSECGKGRLFLCVVNKVFRMMNLIYSALEAVSCRLFVVIAVEVMSSI